MSDMKKCENCGAECPLQAKFCTECSTPFPADVKLSENCTECGALLSPAVKFCPECGKEVRTVIDMPVAPVAVEPKKRPRVIAIAVFVAIALIGGIVAAIASNATPSAEKFVSEFEKAGYQMGDFYMGDLQETVQHMRGVQSIVGYSGEGFIQVSNSPKECEVVFGYIECDSVETANIVFDSLKMEYMDDWKTVYNETNRERVEKTYAEKYLVFCASLSRKGNVVILLWEDAYDESYRVGQSLAYELPATKIIEKYGF